MSVDPSSPRSQALCYVSNRRFHQRFTLPATTDHDSLTVTYADVGRAIDTPGQQSPTILFMPGMFATRYLGVLIHPIAEKLGVRILVVDRPGMGNTAEVPIDQRIPIWLELVPKLLSHLSIDHVALLSHSSGTIYLLNTLYHCRDILHPERPYVAFLAPWVDPAHSHMTSMQLLQLIPTKAFSVWNHIPRFFHLKAGPVFASSGAVVTKIQDAFSSGAQDRASASQAEKNRLKIEKDYGLARDTRVEIESLVFQFLFEENTTGANSEALQCLRKETYGTWRKCDDYGQFVKDLVDLERSSGDSRRERLKIQAYFAESDSMVGKGGQKYMTECWSGHEDFHDVLDFESRTISDVDHDSISQSAEVLEGIFLAALDRMRPHDMNTGSGRV